MNQMDGGHTESGDGVSMADRAMQWFVLLQSGHATSADRREFQEWIVADASRRREFEKCSSLWSELDSAKPLLREELARVTQEWEQGARRPLSCRTVRTWSLARASAVLAAVLVVGIFGGWWFVTGIETAEYRTAKGERRTVILSDGSTITLNTETVVAAAFSFARRTVELREGEAFFTVSHVNRRPFEVLAGNRVVRDVGTRFVVRSQEQHVTVTVVEGAVEVQPFEQAASAQPWQMLTVGEQVSYGPRGALSPVNSVSLAETTAWLDGKVIFKERPLSEVIQEVGRYQAGEVRILDPQIGALKVSGVFGVNDRMGFLNALEHALPVAVSHVTRDVAVLEGRRSLSEKR